MLIGGGDMENYAKRLGLQMAQFEQIVHEDAIIAQVYRVTSGSEQLILKISPDETHYRREVYFLNHLAGHISLPRIVQTVEPEPGLHGAILMESIEGALLADADWSESLAFEIGVTLAHIHRQKTTGYGDVTQPETLVSDPMAYFGDKFEEELDECRGHLPPSLIEECDHFYHAHRPTLKSVDGPRLIHRDFRPGNLLIKDGKLAAVIDWAGARAGFAEQDFCLIEHRNFPNQPTHKGALLAGYATMRPLPDYRAIIPLLRLGRALAVIGYTVKTGTWDGTNAPLYTYNRQALERFF